MPKTTARFKPRIPSKSPKTTRKTTRRTSTRKPNQVKIPGKLLSFLGLGSLIILLISALVVGLAFLFSHEWDGQERLNLVILQPETETRQKITLLSLDGHQESVVAFSPPSDLIVTPLGYSAEVPLSELYDFYEDQQKSERYFYATLAYYFGYVTHHTLSLPSDVVLNNANSIQRNLHFLELKNAKGNLSLVDRWKISRHLSKSKQKIFFDQKNSQLFENQDGKLTVNASQMNQNFTMLLSDTRLQKQNITVAVVNTTQFSGIASMIGNILSSTGYRVINVSSENTAINKSALYVSSELVENPDGFTAISNIFPEEISIQEDQGIVDQYRSDLVLFIGQDASIFPEKKR